jgi:hypothetical protein
MRYLRDVGLDVEVDCHAWVNKTDRHRALVARASHRRRLAERRRPRSRAGPEAPVRFQLMVTYHATRSHGDLTA